MGKPKSPLRQRTTRAQDRRLLPLTDAQEDLLRDKPTRIVPFTPKNELQAAYMNLIEHEDLIFAIGPAGVGKTFCAGAAGAKWVMSGRKLLITRPIVECGESLGFLPGEMDEKAAPYFRPMRDVLEKLLGDSHVEMLIKAKRIEFFPLAYMRGGSFDDTLMVLDEGQNTTPSQMKMFLTRMGEGSTMIVDGDGTQKDITGPSGLVDGLRKARGLAGVGTVEFTSADIVRSGLVQRLVERYEAFDPEFHAEIQAALIGDLEPLDAGMYRALAI